VLAVLLALSAISLFLLIDLSDLYRT